jgi:hypothetical protein
LLRRLRIIAINGDPDSINEKLIDTIWDWPKFKQILKLLFQMLEPLYVELGKKGRPGVMMLFRLAF